ncbi:MAG: hypothetical protein NXI23_08400 [Bacteroidetes bacterium]|jgi:hypothetical protein|nr:hypothetical protein [Bacteroidota bacterium]MDF1864256.1 hypothetical protein [Saprospiraceae bacterium]
MNTTKKWEKSAQNRRFKAIVYTMAFHLILFAGIVYSMNSDIKELIPDFAKEWFWDGEKDLQKEKNSKPSA